MTYKEELEMLYLRTFYESVYLGENPDDVLDSFNAGYQGDIPEEYQR